MAAASNTLLIKHLPEELTNDDKTELLQHLGATHVRCMPNYGRMRRSAFATFASSADASQALLRIHQLELLGNTLVAVRATKAQQSAGLLPNIADFPRIKSEVTKEEKKAEGSEELQRKAEDFQKWLSAILPDIGLDYPTCPVLHYRYPPPTQSIISNISHALAAVPKFYTQVLHLMNRMHLPAPFGPLTMAPPLQAEPPIAELTEEEMEFSSTQESEMESDIEDKSLAEPIKRPSKVKRKRKVLKRQRLLPVPQVSHSSAPAVDPSSVFDKTDVDTSVKRISFNIKPSENVQDPVSEPQVEAGGFGVLERPLNPMQEDDVPNQDLGIRWSGAKFVSRHDIERNRLSSREMKSTSVFKNYQAGDPTCRLYVKNLAKQVDETTLFTIYGRYVKQNSEEERNMFDIRLMKEGRMKGQAFVTLASQGQAKTALQDTNGYLLHGKPIVVQFARSAKPKRPVM